MSTHCLNFVRLKKCPNPSSKLVLFVLANYANEQNTCFPSEKHLGEICGISDRSVRRCLVQLEHLRYISIKRRKGNTNLFTICMDTSVRTGMDTSVRRVRTPASDNTLNIQQRRSQNELAG